MPKIKERDQNDKIKKTGKAQQPKGVLRIMTAKLRKNMAQHGQQGEEHTADTQAVEQSTRVGTFATREIGNRVERVAERMIHPSRHPKTRKGKIKGDGYIPKFGTSELPPAVDTPEHGIAVNSNTLGETAGGPQHPYITKKNILSKINRSIHQSKSAPGAPLVQKKNHPAGYLHQKLAKVLKNLPQEQQRRQRQLYGKQCGHPPPNGPWNRLAGKHRWQLNGICCKKQGKQPRLPRNFPERPPLQ